MNALLWTARRCLCGNLLCQVCKAGVEIKCRRCKRLVMISPAGDPLANSLQTDAIQNRVPCPLITTSGNIHCLCGTLLSKKTEIHLELKCRRCKRSVALALQTNHQRPEVMRPESEAVPAGTG